ncbi:aminotransferase class I/II-fold pyridoxal phosphate-dependent enzyme [Bacillus aerolatus]|uniref:Aminotransferase class I/II-fold pyridoxal phosphate-dependent enzyme n=1 Tax=Bacillus aerolatus TaxID=2653354 RepID=A0A6I1FCX2_9BACI|nr:PLP-dependent aminotransferase family protein [Bacillus aerolatus]KAB7705319.1 aminotransferase class I/II-fold pyridoxal phosphate-dependent enzyme [Bacillus aerolatus]
MEWKPNFNEKKPVYKQIAEYIELKISTGDYLAGSKLPSERALAKELKVNRSTIIAAYEELRAAGIVTRREGSGTHVSADIWGLSHQRTPNWNRYVEYGSFLPNDPLARRIRKETQEKNIINFATGELSADLFPSSYFQQLLAEKPFDGYLGYDHPQGNLSLRETIVSHVREFKKVETSASSVLITSGAQQALHLIVQCLLKPGDAVAIEDPSYSFSLPLFQSAGLRTFLLPVDEHGVKPEDILSLYQKHRIRMVFLNPDFQNPTGTVLHLERRKEILELSSLYGIPIIEDDPYSLTSFTGKINPTLKSMDENGNVLYITSLTKIVASGLRIGWIIGPDTVIERLADAKQQIDFGHSIFPQWVAEQFLSSDSFSSHIVSLRNELKRKRDLLVASLKEQIGSKVRFHVPEGGIHLWVKLTEDIDENKLLEAAIKHGVAFVPGRLLGSEKGWMRFTFARPEAETIQEGIDRFAQALYLFD